ncbi:PIG-L family deacetylase [Methylobacterium durans]|uniref:PIG-L deacetylase family protein n=1 Tax=Methylobacterium durans TaxID=2202825 RepID=UPI002AFE1D2E|nr:PIG-L family deacetylase [Methylobacterium durans]MEA1831378.1 PIG-L family deacetylase [Methylobacterium durans]
MRADAFLAAAEALPFGRLDDLAGAGGLVVVAPHPDDESLGCGGLIAEGLAAGRALRLVVVSDGAGSHPNSRAYPPESLTALRERETVEAASILGLGPEHITFLRLPDGAVPSSGPDAENAARAIAGVAAASAAGGIVVTWRHDPHCDHAASAAIVALARPLCPGLRVHAYPVWGWSLPPDTEIADEPRGLRLDVSAHRAAKERAIRAHGSQVTDLIDDDPEGFRLPPEMIARFLGSHEIFLEVAA